jgi:hypothetical protein
MSALAKPPALTRLPTMTARDLKDLAIVQTFGAGRGGRVDSGLVELCDFFAPCKEGGKSLVLATIIRTDGSTNR